jgi:hypothetical protein
MRAVELGLAPSERIERILVCPSCNGGQKVRTCLRRFGGRLADLCLFATDDARARNSRRGFGNIYAVRGTVTGHLRPIACNILR